MDPRPEFRDDSLMWSRLLQLAAERWPEWFWTPWAYLWSARCHGARLQNKRGGSLKFSPTIGEVDTWPTRADWEEMRDAYLEPHAKAIAPLLSRVRTEFRKAPVG